VRRIMFALLVIVLTAVVPLSSRAGAAVATKPLVLPATRSSWAPSRGRHPAAPRLVRVASSVSLNIDELRDKWQQVAICEVSGNWSMVGPSFSGIGFANGTWSQYGAVALPRWPVTRRETSRSSLACGSFTVRSRSGRVLPYGW